MDLEVFIETEDQFWNGERVRWVCTCRRAESSHRTRRYPVQPLRLARNHRRCATIMAELHHRAQGLDTAHTVSQGTTSDGLREILAHSG